MKLLKAEAVAKILDVSKARVYELIRLEILPAVKLGRQVRVEEQDLYEWIALGGRDLAGGWKREPLERPDSGEDREEVPF